MTTRDTLFDGRVALTQPARGEGYRTNVDALLLASFARAKGAPAKTAFDLGAGAGAVALALLHWGACEKVVLVEIDSDAAALARTNLEANGWSARAKVLGDDVGRAARVHRGEAHLIVCNPPYIAPGRGRVAKVASRARARSGDLAAFVVAARMLLGRRGRACFVYPAREMVSLFESLRASGLEPKRVRAVRATEIEPARIVLVEAMAAKAGGLVVEPDLVERCSALRGTPGYSPELARIIAGG